MIYGFLSGEYELAEYEGMLTPIGYWSDMDDTPVSARNYAYVGFKEHESNPFLMEDVYDFLDAHFGLNEWHAEPHNDDIFNMAVADETVSVFPFTVRRRVIFIQKHYSGGQLVEEPFPIPTREEMERDREARENDCD